LQGWSGALFLDLSLARRADAQLEVGRRDRQHAPLASTNKFEEWDRVLRSTTPCVVESSFNSADFGNAEFHRLMFLRAVPGAVILKFTLDQAWDKAFPAQFYAAVLYSLLRKVESLQLVPRLWK